MMAMPSRLTADGTYCKAITGTEEEFAALDASYAHLCALRDQVIGMGVIPPVAEWKTINPNMR